MNKSAPWQQLLGKPAAGHHIAQLYRTQEQLTETVCHFICEGLQQNEAVILVVTPEHWASFVARLEADSTIDLVDAVLRGQLRIRDAQITLTAIMSDGAPEWNNFEKLLGDEIGHTSRRYKSIRIYGEMVDLLWKQGQYAAANCLEEFWNELARQQLFSLFCAYQLESQDVQGYEMALQYACKTHSHIVRESGGEAENDSALRIELIQQ